MLKIYHNPRCSKSREGLAILEASGKEFEVIKYLENPLTLHDLITIMELLDIEPIDLVRKSEKIWKEQFKGQDHSKAQVIQALLNHPKLIERPIVVHNDKAVIGRPPEKINDIL